MQAGHAEDASVARQVYLQSQTASHWMISRSRRITKRWENRSRAPPPNRHDVPLARAVTPAPPLKVTYLDRRYSTTLTPCTAFAPKSTSYTPFLVPHHYTTSYNMSATSHVERFITRLWAGEFNHLRAWGNAPIKR
jgi:hypothetical protein